MSDAIDRDAAERRNCIRLRIDKDDTMGVTIWHGTARVWMDGDSLSGEEWASTDLAAVVRWLHAQTDQFAAAYRAAPPAAEPAPCGTCGGSGQVGAPCPDGPILIGGVRVSCAVLHQQPCPSCRPGGAACPVHGLPLPCPARECGGAPPAPCDLCKGQGGPVVPLPGEKGWGFRDACEKCGSFGGEA